MIKVNKNLYKVGLGECYFNSCFWYYVELWFVLESIVYGYCCIIKFYMI